jgi:hypothetical protein
MRVSRGADKKANTRVAAHPRLVIFVSLRMAASVEAPWSPIMLPPRLRARGGVGMVRVGVSMGADKKANARAAAHSRSEIIVSLRMAASADAPSTPMLLPRRLQVRGGARIV